MKKGSANLPAALSALPPKVRRALEASHAALLKVGVPHALIGGIAVAAHGYVRNTKDVDWLVGDEAFKFHGKLVTMREGVPYEYGGVAIDYLSPEAPGEASSMSKGAAIAIVPVEQLFRQKLKAWRAKDQGDLVELIKRGAPADRILDYLKKVAKPLLPKFADILDRAAQEDE